MTATPHDGIYKQLFSHPQMVEALLRGFVHEDWVEHLDLATLEKANGQYVSEELLQRSEDVTWRVRLNLPDGRQEWLYLYLLIEFQRKEDPWMALRFLTYVCLLYQDLIKSGQIKGNHRLPPVFPIVIYNGEAEWRAMLEVAELIAAPAASLARFSPRFRYHLLDEGRVPRAELDNKPDNLLAHVITLEASRLDTPQARAALDAVEEYFSRYTTPAYDSLRRAILTFYRRSVFARLNLGETIGEFKDFQEVNAMYATRVERWTAELRQEGRLKGREEGLQEGLQKGLQKGEANLLLRLLTRRFGSLSEATSERINTASSAELERWTDNILDARTLEEVFRAH